MGEANETVVEDASRMKWNDIRIIGPVLVMMMLAAMLVSPQFSSADQSVGTTSLDECYRFAVAEADATAGVFIAPECCLDGDVLRQVGGLAICPPPEPTVDAKPAPTPVPPPDPIIGPIWLGAIDAEASGGLVTLTPPVLLGLFIKDNHVKVTDSDGDVVFYGPRAANGTIVFFGSGGEYTVETTLRTGAKYTEMVSTGSGGVN